MYSARKCFIPELLGNVSQKKRLRVFDEEEMRVSGFLTSKSVSC